MENKTIMPTELTHENGNKGLWAEKQWFVNVEFRNPEYCDCPDPESDDDNECEYCGHSLDEPEYINQKVVIDWTTVKNMYRDLVEYNGENITNEQGSIKVNTGGRQFGATKEVKKQHTLDELTASVIFQKIYRPIQHIPNSRNFNAWEYAKETSIMQVERMLLLIPMYTGELNPKWVKWTGVLDELENMEQ